MKAIPFVLLLAICTIECRKIVQVSKNANIDFINMESGGGARPVAPTLAPPKPLTPEAPKTPTVVQPKTPVPVTTAKPVPVVPTVPPHTEIKPLAPNPVKPLAPNSVKPIPNQMDLKPVPAIPAKPTPAGSVTTPGYGNVKQLVTFYDSQGKASVIRPYSYADAVKKQG